jgi:hypothetical protein
MRPSARLAVQKVKKTAAVYDPPLLPGLPFDVPAPSLIGGFPGGCPSGPLPTPLLPFANMLPDCAMADELIVVESKTTIVGGTATAKRPASARNCRRSARAA